MHPQYKPPGTICWPHAPTHKLAEKGTYFVTCGTYLKQHIFRDRERLDVLQRGLLKVANEYPVALEAWAIFSNHYHIVAHSPIDYEDASSLFKMLKKFHSKTAIWVNSRGKRPGRHVRHNYRETKLTEATSCRVRLNYTHQNAVKHGLVQNPLMYPWCIASWLSLNPCWVLIQFSFLGRAPREAIAVAGDILRAVLHFKRQFT